MDVLFLENYTHQRKVLEVERKVSLALISLAFIRKKKNSSLNDSNCVWRSRNDCIYRADV